MAGHWRVQSMSLAPPAHRPALTPLVHRLHMTLVLLVALASWAPLGCATQLKIGGSSPSTGTPVYSKDNPEPVFKETWVISTETINGDCLADRPTTVVNGEYPGPLVKVKEGTRVLITVKNEQEIPVTIHWHGITQKHSQWHDGVGQVTQCDIRKGETFVYNFSTEGHSGNMWWHAHVVAIRNTVLGGLIVTPRSYDVPGRKAPPMGEENVVGEHVILLSDWYQPSSKELVEGTVGYPFQGWPPPDTLHINGKTRLSCQTMAEFDVEPRKWYYLRVTNGALYATLNFIVQHHNLWTYESETGYLKPRRFKSYDIMSGQSYTFLLYTSQKSGAYWVASRPRFDVEGYGGLPGLAILRYKGVDKKKIPKGRGVYFGPNLSRNPYFTQGQIEKTKGAVPPPDWIKKVDQLVVLQMNMHNNKNEKGQEVTRYSWNNFTTLLPTEWSPLEAEWEDSEKSLKKLNPGQIPDKPPKGFSKVVDQEQSITGFSTVDLKFNATVQIVFNGHIPPGLNHPIHLHGHNFWIVGYGTGLFDVDKWEEYDYNLKDPVDRNTGWLLEGGWTAIRFRTDNPGIWLMHCHLEPHVEAGMMVVFREHLKDGIPPPPADYPKCVGGSGH